jgi:hypothetical protein
MTITQVAVAATVYGYATVDPYRILHDLAR